MSKYVEYIRVGSGEEWPVRDAAAHEELGNRAPTGFGLGVSEPVVISDCNQATKSGWYKTTDSTLNSPLARGCWMRVDAYSDKWTHQVWFNDTNGGGEVHRYQQNGVWTAWEWENPPMQVSVEYRTTERWKGYPVYTQLIDMGVVTSNGETSVNTGIANTKIINVRFLSYSTVFGITATMPQVNGDTGEVNMMGYCSATYLTVKTYFNAHGGYSAYAIIKYIKA